MLIASSQTGKTGFLFHGQPPIAGWRNAVGTRATTHPRTAMRPMLTMGRQPGVQPDLGPAQYEVISRVARDRHPYLHSNFTIACNTGFINRTGNQARCRGSGADVYGAIVSNAVGVRHQTRDDIPRD